MKNDRHGEENLRQDLCDNIEMDFLWIILHGNTSYLTIVLHVSTIWVFIFRYEKNSYTCKCYR
jgi:hypothetical protein